jgi:two-component system NarL family sensor kinase
VKLATRIPGDPKRVIDGLIRLNESERSRVSGLLADDVVPVMTMARYLIEDAARRLARAEWQDNPERGAREDTPKSLQNAAARIRDAADRLLGLSHQLRPRVIDDLGLLATLVWCLREFGQQHRAVLVSQRFGLTESEIPAALKLPILRIVQAALSNVARHSKASAVWVLLSRFEDELRLSVEDNGVGFDVECWRHRRRRQDDGCGLAIIWGWVESSGGHCRIQAPARHGARLRACWRIDPAVSSAATPAGAEAGAPAD